MGKRERGAWQLSLLATTATMRHLPGDGETTAPVVGGELNTTYDNGYVKLVQGDARTVLAEIEAESVHCVVTSPPYWGLRDYKIEPVVWDADETCEHEWLDWQESQTLSFQGKTKRMAINKIAKQARIRDRQVNNERTSAGQQSRLQTDGLQEAEQPIGESLATSAERDPRKAAPVHRPIICQKCYAIKCSLGLEPIPDCLAWARGKPPCSACYVCHMRVVAKALWRVLRKGGTFWLNLGDSYAGSYGGESDYHEKKGLRKDIYNWAKPQSRFAKWQSDTPNSIQVSHDVPRTFGSLKPKDLVGIPWRVAFALQADGWWLRSDIIYSKLNPMPESVQGSHFSRHRVTSDREGQSQEASGLCSSEERNSSNTASNSEGLVGNLSATQESLLLLQESPITDARPRNTPEQRGPTRQGEHSASLPSVQLNEEGQDNSALIDCPGCPKCEEHGGYIHHLSAGRPTKSHEYLFLLTKSSNYYYDQNAILEKAAYDGHQDTIMKGSTKFQDGFVPNQPEQTVHARGNERWPQRKQFEDNEGGAGSSFLGHSGYLKADGTSISADVHARNKRSVWTIASEPFPSAHFATFPEKLVEPCILAGTSEKGCCAACGKPWVRVIQKQASTFNVRVRDALAGKATPAEGYKASPKELAEYGGKQCSDDGFTTTPGWQPSCSCATDIVPCTILDPFIGSGTTAVVAQKLGRKCIGIDMNENFLELAKRRLTEVPMPMKLET